jgi:hypothetical protein
VELNIRLQLVLVVLVLQAHLLKVLQGKILYFQLLPLLVAVAVDQTHLKLAQMEDLVVEKAEQADL